MLNSTKSRMKNLDIWKFWHWVGTGDQLHWNWTWPVSQINARSFCCKIIIPNFSQKPNLRSQVWRNITLSSKWSKHKLSDHIEYQEKKKSSCWTQEIHGNETSLTTGGEKSVERILITVLYFIFHFKYGMIQSTRHRKWSKQLRKWSIFTKHLKIYVQNNIFSNSNN